MSKNEKLFAKVDPVAAIMNIEKGEEIAGAWITPEIPEIGLYKLLAKKKADGTCEWAHFIERPSGAKESLYTGTTKDENELSRVVDVMNRNLRRVFGTSCQLRPARMVARPIDDSKLGIDRNN